MRTLVVFVDGVGIGPPDERYNPFLQANVPHLRALLGSVPTLSTPRLAGDHGCAFPLDARLDTPGLPQSGTGQVALLTGENGAELFGRHFGPWVPVRLRGLLAQRSIFRRALDSGHRVAFANAYPEAWGETTDGTSEGTSSDRRARRLRSSAHPFAAASAGLLTRPPRLLAAGRAVASDIINTGWRARPETKDIPDVTPREAGRTLVRIASDADLAYFAHYATDAAGHAGTMEAATAALERVDAFLGGILDTLPRSTLLLLTSDHGNLEDIRAGHTLNPALGLLVGPEAPDRARGLASIRDIADAVLGWLAA